MKTFEYSPFPDIYLPYIVYPNKMTQQKLRDVWEILANTPLPFMSKWVIYQALRRY